MKNICVVLMIMFLISFTACDGGKNIVKVYNQDDGLIGIYENSYIDYPYRLRVPRETDRGVFIMNITTNELKYIDNCYATQE